MRTKKVKTVHLLGEEVEVTYLKLMDVSLYADVDANIEVYFCWQDKCYMASFFAYPENSPTLKSDIVEWQDDMFYVPTLDEASINKGLIHILSNHQASTVFQETDPVKQDEMWLGVDVSPDVRNRVALDPASVESAELRARDAVYGALTQLHVFGLAATEEEAINWLQRTAQSIFADFIEGDSK